MKKYLLPKEGKFYKACLHVHTKVSDGALSPKEIKEAYVSHGFSVIAYTDHEIMVPHNDLTDENFLALTSTEVSVNKMRNCPFEFTKVYHLNFYSKDPNKTIYNTFDKNALWLKHVKDYIDPKQWEIQYNRVYSVECINEMIKMANEEGFFVSLNHPVWSLQDYSDYIDLKGLWGVEWHNTGCVYSGYSDTIAPIDDLLRVGERVFPLATDDAHNLDASFGGWVMVKSKELKYDAIYEALKNGEFYSSTGPEIEELYIEDGIINIKTSKVKAIDISSDKRYATRLSAEEGEYLTAASIDVNWYLSLCDKNIIKNQYLRITLIDENGKVAHTRAYFIEELK